MNSDLEIKMSTLPNTGKGLFTKRDIKKGERFVEYLGEIITEEELNIRADKDIYGYAFYISKKKCIDAYYCTEEFARYANDANGLRKIKGLRNNCVYDIYINKAWIRATKNIKAGEEIFVRYGPEYWRDIRYNLKLDEKKNKKKK